VEVNADYIIRQSVLFDNGRGFALGESPRAPAPLSHGSLPRKRGRDYYWGHYHGDRAAAEKDFAARIEDYKRRFGVHEVMRPIKQQLAEARELAKEEKMQEKDNPLRNAEMALEQNFNQIDGIINNLPIPEEKPKDKVLEPPKKHRGRDREER
jgi:hypothetical protein